MSRKTRYLILFAGFIAFILFAPLIALYASGYSFDFKNHSFVRTGILTLRSDPSSVNVYVNDKLVRKNDGDIQFLKPGDYNVKVEKNGYRTWQKRLPVKQGEVTWVSPAPEKLGLFLSDNQTTTVADNVSNFLLADNNLLTLSTGTLSLSPTDNPNSRQNFSLPSQAQSLVLSPDSKTILLTGGTSTLLSFNISSKTLTDLSPLFTEEINIQFSDDNNLYALDKNQLYRVGTNPLQKTPVVSGVKSFYVAFNNIYYISANNDLMLLPVGQTEPQTLLPHLPNFQMAKIFLTPQKQMFVQLDSGLYRVGKTLELVADNVSDINYDRGNNQLLILHGGELNAYDFGSQSLQFITRTSLPLHDFVVNPSLGYAFFVKGNDVEALELDLRDHQNEYVFYSGTDVKKIYVSDDAKEIYIFDGPTLKQIKIR